MNRIEIQRSVEPSEFRHDRNNCTVHAISNACMMNFEWADDVVTRFGRKRNRGCAGACLALDLKKLTNGRFTAVKVWSRWDARKGTCDRRIKGLTSAIRYLPKNKSYFVLVTRHAVAIVDGVLYDNLFHWTDSPRHQVKGIYEIQESCQPAEKLQAA